MAALALAVVGLLGLPDRGWVRLANLVIWGVFVADYVTRYVLATDKRAYVRGSVVDLVAIIPFEFFRPARVLRLARLVRSGSVLWRVMRRTRAVMGTHGLGWVLAAAVVLVFVGSVAVWSVEPRYDSFGDALWWSLVTATTVGYGDLSPETGVGRAVAAVLMLGGIGTLGMLTAAIASYFIAPQQAARNEQVEWVREQLAGWDEMEPEERRRVAAMLEGLANHDG